MRGQRTFTLSYDEDASQIVLDDLPEGPAGGANLIAAPGLELAFDCADGQLSRVFADTAGTETSAEADEVTIALAGPLLGSEVGAAFRQARRKDRHHVMVADEAATMTALSRLARLDTARMTSPVSKSPLWAVEAAQLADQAGLGARAAAEIRRALEAFDSPRDMSPGVLAAAASAVADLVAAADPDLPAEYALLSPLPRRGAQRSGPSGWPCRMVAPRMVSARVTLDSCIGDSTRT